ncbi:ImmA/IrrE family metallo-endopeptidase [Bacteriovorax sp. Seq25_V]|uniref:ImmA/IrrE family metallo-endopeptidase n=1 Tax=Bacteriovorax sp. Seq25_V TaxID=1201288 RepID=UPI0018DF6417|nr:hypothetical protein [Bacteriovorax sp. Seq25_V]
MKIKTIAQTLLALGLSSIALASPMTEQSFHQVIDEVLSHYQEQIELKYGPITFDTKWESKVANASVSYRKNKVIMTFHGEFPRKYNLTDDAFAITVCHEVGHLLAGEPKVYPTKKYSAEAQADYFATSECLPRIFKDDRIRMERAILDSREIYGNASVDTPSTEVVTITNVNDYPSKQCRFDTLIAGLNQEQRPACWFNDSYDFTTWDYKENYVYEEAQILGTAGKVTLNPLGCHVEVNDIDFYGPSYLAPLEESDIYSQGFFIVGKCDINENSDFSGSLSYYRGKIYRNLNSNDK